MTSHTNIFDYTEDLISVPKAHIKLELHQDQMGLKLLHEEKLLVEYHLTREGMAAAGYTAMALGVKLPSLGESVTARVSTGVLFRVISISSLDFSNKESYKLLERWLEEAELQRGGSSDAT